MDSAAARAFSSSTDWFLQIAARCGGHLEKAGMGVWSVRDLLGHTSRSLSTVEDYLDAAAGRGLQVEFEDAAAYYLATQGAMADVEAVAERGRAAGVKLGEDPATTLVDMATRVRARVADAEADAMIATPFGAMT